MRLHTKSVLTAVAALALVAPPSVATATQPGQADQQDGLTATAVTALNRLVTLDVTSGTQESSAFITGLNLGDRVAGIDYRPATGELYGVVLALTGKARLVVIDPDTARIQSSVPLLEADGSAVVLRASGYGIDFNPAADALRVTTTNGQNLRVDVTTGSVTVDGDLAYAAGDEAEGKRPSIVASAYTNNDQQPVGTTELFNLDSVRDTLVRQDPPNDGVLSTVERIRGLDVALVSGFDITGDGELGVISAPSLLGTRLQLIEIDGVTPVLSRQVPLAAVTDLALVPED